MIITGKYPSLRLRRNRKSDWSRRLTSENNISSDDLILPIFLVEGKNKKMWENPTRPLEIQCINSEP